ncbi:MAG: transporter [Prevotella sp.]|nr:transporter [Prevotella sp.]
MEAKINWKLVITFIIIIGGLFYITESYLMSLGILLLLFVAYDFVLKKAKEEEERQKREEDQ